MKRTISVTAALMLALGIAPATAMALPRAQDAQQPAGDARDESWQKEFDAVCAKTQDAMSLAEAELKALVQRCDALEPSIEKLDETRRKVYLRRLRQCRGLYAYVLESKSNDKK